MVKKNKKKKPKKCPECKKGNLHEEYEDCAFCGGGMVYVCDNSDCYRMFDEKMNEI